MFNTMRYTAASQNNGLADVMSASLTAGLGLSPKAFRQLGFRRLDAALDAIDAELGYRAAASPLPERSQVVLDNAVTSVGTQRLQFIAELISRGLVYPLPNAMSIPFLENMYDSNVGAPSRVMNPEARVEHQMNLMIADRLPIYITKAEFAIGIRELGMSRRVGLPLDTRNITQQTRAINEAIEDAGVNGATTLDGQALIVGGYDAPGLLTAPNVNTVTVTSSAWKGTAPVGATVQAEMNTMYSRLFGDFKRGPYTLFIPSDVDFAFNIDFKANGNDSIRTRLQQNTTGGAPLRIVTLDSLPQTKVVLAQMTNDVMDLVDGQRPTVIPYTSATGMTFFSMIMAIMVPRFKTDYDGNSGIVVATLT